MLMRGAVLSALATFFLFLSVYGNEFVALDDYAYIVNNQHIAVLDWSTLRWVSTAFHEGNWHPLTMLSLALDRHVWGLNPFGYHLTNILIHSSTVLCACFLFAAFLERAVIRLPANAGVPLASLPAVTWSAIAGSLFFGLHPLRVESVVWASERKDVLCLFFLTTSLWWYLRYANQYSIRSQESFYKFSSYWISLSMAGLALMSKPTAVSLPLVLLILDWYPLDRMTDRQGQIRSVLEKIPYLLLSSAGAILTLAAQQVAIDSAPDVGLVSRLLVACKALLFYLVKTVWPADLAAFYMHPGNVAGSNLFEYLLYVAIVLCLILFVTLRRQRLWSALALFYGVTLAPMIGLIQVGGQWAADRYSYLPALGLSLAWGCCVVWTVLHLRQAGRTLAMGCCIALAVCQLTAYAVLTVRQIRVWKDTDTLATRIIELAPHQSGAAYYARALYRSDIGKHEQALDDITEAMKIALRGNLKRTYSILAMSQSRILYSLERYAEALVAADWAVETSDTPLPIDFLNLRIELAQKAETAVKPGRPNPVGR